MDLACFRSKSAVGTPLNNSNSREETDCQQISEPDRNSPVAAAAIRCANVVQETSIGIP